MKKSLKQYIEQRQLSLLYTFNNQHYFEDQLGNVVSLKQIERDYFDSITIKNNYKTLLTRYRLQGNWVISESQNLEESMLNYRKLLKSRLLKNRPDRYSFQYRFKHQNDWTA